MFQIRCKYLKCIVNTCNQKMLLMFQTHCKYSKQIANLSNAL